MARLMLIDDEPLVLNTLRRTLSFGCKGVDIITAQQPTEALSQLANNEFDLVLTDRHMPGMSGEELIRRVRQQSPQTLCGLLTGDHITPTWYSAEGITTMLPKPINTKELIAVVQWAMQWSKWNHHPEIRKQARLFQQMLPPDLRGEFPYDGRTGGKRWFEAYGTATNMDRESSSSASILKLMLDDFVPVIAIITGVMDGLARVADRHTVEHHWQEMLTNAQEARNDSAAHGGNEQTQLQAQIHEYLAGFSQLLAVIFDDATSRLGWVLPVRWGLTYSAVHAAWPRPALATALTEPQDFNGVR